MQRPGRRRPPHQGIEAVLIQPPVVEHVAGHDHVTGPGVQVLPRILCRHAAAHVQAALESLQRAQRRLPAPRPPSGPSPAGPPVREILTAAAPSGRPELGSSPLPTEELCYHHYRVKQDGTWCLPHVEGQGRWCRVQIAAAG